jgi:hypothetical protein
VEDVLDSEIINMRLSGKMKMVYPSLNVGDEVYVTVSLFEPNRGRLTTPDLENEKFGHDFIKNLDKELLEIKA